MDFKIILLGVFFMQIMRVQRLIILQSNILKTTH